MATAGIETGVTGVVLDRASKGLDLQTGEPDKRVFEYTSVTACQLSIPGGANSDAPCVGAVQACAGNTPQQGQGPQVRLYRRELNAQGAPISPFGNTYFEVAWPTTGFQPVEIDTTTLLGNQVRIRPTVQGYTYVFGDWTSSGPTLSPGGRYPDGDVTHAYAKAGTYASRIDITYGGEFSVGGAACVPIPDTVTVAGQVQPVTVRTARAGWSSGSAAGSRNRTQQPSVLQRSAVDLFCLQRFSS